MKKIPKIFFHKYKKEILWVDFKVILFAFYCVKITVIFLRLCLILFFSYLSCLKSTVNKGKK